MLKCISMQNLIQMYHVVKELKVLTDHDRPDCCSAKPCPCYACLWLDNVDMHAYAKFDQNIPCCSRVMFWSALAQ